MAAVVDSYQLICTSKRNPQKPNHGQKAGGNEQANLQNVIKLVPTGLRSVKQVNDWQSTYLSTRELGRPHKIGDSFLTFWKLIWISSHASINESCLLVSVYKTEAAHLLW